MFKDASDFVKKNNNCINLNLDFSIAQAPGLKRTMARRQPSSVLSICISLILLTSSVRTLNDDRLKRFYRVKHKEHKIIIARNTIISITKV